MLQDGGHSSAEASRLLGGGHDLSHATWPGWLAAILAVAAAGAVLYVTLTSARARAVAGTRQPAKCYALSDAELVRSLAADGFTHRPIATTSPAAQALFDLGMLAAHGFNQDEATSMFQVRVCSVLGSLPAATQPPLVHAEPATCWPAGVLEGRPRLRDVPLGAGVCTGQYACCPVASREGKC